MRNQVLQFIAQQAGNAFTKAINKKVTKSPGTPMEAESPEEALERIYGEDKSVDITPELKEEIIEKLKGIDTATIDIATACLPCTGSHLHACVGLLNEAVRFARKDGINLEVIKRIDNCLGEIVAAERIDLTPEAIVNLPAKEKEIASEAAIKLRDIRHDLENISSLDELEQIAARAQELQHKITYQWFQSKLASAKLTKQPVE
ncbi:MAG: hypothetical protein V3U97_04090 [bacterium]